MASARHMPTCLMRWATWAARCRPSSSPLASEQAFRRKTCASLARLCGRSLRDTFWTGIDIEYKGDAGSDITSSSCRTARVLPLQRCGGRDEPRRVTHPAPTREDDLLGDVGQGRTGDGQGDSLFRAK